MRYAARLLIVALTCIFATNPVCGFSQTDRSAVPSTIPVPPGVPGQFDGLFGQGGRVTTNFLSSSYNLGADVAAAADGSVFFAGLTISTGLGRFSVSKVRSNGRLDPSFGIGGTATASFAASTSAFAETVIVLPDGRIVAAGVVTSGTNFSGQTAFARFLPDGRLDPSFGTDGLVVFDAVPGRDERLRTLILQPDGKIVGGGNSNDSLNSGLIVRLTPDGDPDPTFGSGGVVTLNAPEFGVTQVVMGLATASNGRLIAAVQSSDEIMYVAFLNANGMPDASAGVGGFVAIDFPGFDESALDVCMRPDGRVLVAGYRQVLGEMAEGVVVQLQSDGTLDGSFGLNGVAIVSVNRFCQIRSCVLLAGGELLVSMLTSDGEQAEDSTARLRTDGSLDTSYGVSGVSTAPMQSGSNVFSLAVDRAGFSVTCGYVPGAALLDCRLLRRGPNGSLDTGFDSDGLAVIDVKEPGDDMVLDLEILGDGKTTALGSASLVRYNRDGTLDRQFGQAGRVVFSPADVQGASKIAVQRDGKILVCGQTRLPTGEYAACVQRFTATGARDVRFGRGSIACVLHSYAIGRAVAAMPDGRIVLAGSYFPNGTDDGFIARLTSTGQLDRSFAGGNVFVLDRFQDELFEAVSVRTDGSIVAAGKIFVFGPTGRAINLVELSPTGQPVPAFGQNGFTILSPPDGHFVMTDMALQNDGKALVTGYFAPPADKEGTDIDTLILRVGRDGQLDPSFGVGGVSSIDIGEYDFGSGIVIAPDGRSLVAGGANGDSYVARFTTTGALDSTFANLGVLRTGFESGTTSYFSAIGLRSYEGRIVAGGTVGTERNGDDFALASIWNR